MWVESHMTYWEMLGTCPNMALAVERDVKQQLTLLYFLVLVALQRTLETVTICHLQKPQCLSLSCKYDSPSMTLAVDVDVKLTLS